MIIGAMTLKTINPITTATKIEMTTDNTSVIELMMVRREIINRIASIGIMINTTIEAAIITIIMKEIEVII